MLCLHKSFLNEATSRLSVFEQQGVPRRLVVYALLAVCSSILVSAVYTVVSSTTIIQSGWAAAPIDVSVYWDAACTDAVTAIEWSTVEAGASKDKTVYIQNTENTTIYLVLDTENWYPSTASQYITLSWDYGGQAISPGVVVKAILTLTVSPRITGITDFSFDIIAVHAGNAAPVADTGPDQSAYVGDVVSWDGTGSYDPDGAIVRYDWDFGDEKRGSGARVTHAYTSEGTYTVTLTVTDNGGLTSFNQATVMIDSLPTEQTMHVEDITITTTTRSWKTEVLARAAVTVTILDASDAPVDGVTVHGTWSKGYTKDICGVTNADGTVSFKTRWITGPETVEFYVTDVMKTGWIYDPDSNRETWDSTEI
jgi:PKD repeat protein